MEISLLCTLGMLQIWHGYSNSFVPLCILPHSPQTAGIDVLSWLFFLIAMASDLTKAIWKWKGFFGSRDGGVRTAVLGGVGRIVSASGSRGDKCCCSAYILLLIQPRIPQSMEWCPPQWGIIQGRVFIKLASRLQSVRIHAACSTWPLWSDQPKPSSLGKQPE